MTRQKQIVGLVVSLGVSFAVSLIGAVASINAAEYYSTLVQPPWAPPSSVFGPVWTALYAMMAIAAWLVWREGGTRRNRLALGVYVAQLGLNALWSWLFFAWHLGGAALADILALWAMILATVLLFWRVRPLAGLLLVPYLLWVSFATALNYVVWQLNPQLLG